MFAFNLWGSDAAKASWIEIINNFTGNYSTSDTVKYIVDRCVDPFGLGFCILQEEYTVTLGPGETDKKYVFTVKLEGTWFRIKVRDLPPHAVVSTKNSACPLDDDGTYYSVFTLPLLTTSCKFTINIPFSAIALTLSAKPNFDDPPRPGNDIDYEYVVANQSDKAVDDITVSDSVGHLGNEITCGTSDTNTIEKLEAGESETCSATYVIKQNNINNGRVVNTAIAQPKGTLIKASAVVGTPIKQVIGLELAARIDPDTYSAPGDELSFIYEVTNPGNVTLTSVLVVGAPGGICDIGTMSAAGKSECSTTDHVTLADMNAGSIELNAWALGRFRINNVYSNKASATATCMPAATGSVSFKNEIEGGPPGQKFTYKLEDACGNDVPLNPSELGDGEETTAENVLTGDATLTLTPAAGWALTVSGDGCVLEDGGSITVKVEEGEETECTITNTIANSSITITKQTRGGYGSFDFKATGRGVVDFDLTTESDSTS
ncbi:MAG: hypothetical protein GY877_08735, partial [Hyphomicrobium sp.]|nr:hypothetical protein [Hyphomicrobium sp.]